MIDDVRHKDGVAVARVRRQVEAATADHRHRIVIQALRQLFINVDNGRVALVLLVVGWQEERRLQFRAGGARVVDQPAALRPTVLLLVRVGPGQPAGILKRFVGDVVIRVILYCLTRKQKHVGILRLVQSESVELGVVPEEPGQPGLGAVQSSDPGFLGRLAVDVKVNRAGEINAFVLAAGLHRFLFRIEQYTGAVANPVLSAIDGEVDAGAAVDR